MSLESFREYLQTKITSQVEFIQQLHKFIPRAGRYLPSKTDGVGTFVAGLESYVRDAFGSGVGTQYVHNTVRFNLPATRWWAFREALRCDVLLHHGMPMHELLSELGLEPMFAAPVFARPSAADRNRWIYTPTIEDGENDRQRVVTLPRALRGNPTTWHLTDADMANMESTYQALINDELEAKFGDLAAIIEAYESGPGSCMTMGKGYISVSSTGVHPVSVYDAPGWGMAVVRKGGSISQRCLVWINPEDPTDKRAVRIYGSGPLLRRLQRHGFAFKGMDGVRLKRIRANTQHEAGKNTETLVMPYLDGPNGANNGVCVIDRGDSVEIVADSSRIRKFRTLGEHYCPQASHTGGLIDLATLSDDVLYWTCALTGKRFDRTKSTPVKLLMASDLTKPVDVSAAPSDAVIAYINTDHQRFAIAADVPRFVRSPHTYVDTPELRTMAGFVKLDATLYPERQDWVIASTDGIVSVTYRGQTIHVDQNDIMAVIDKDPETGTVFTRLTRSVADRSDYVRVRRTDEFPDFQTLVSREVPTVTVVRSGKTYVSVPGVHAVVQTSGGRWVLRDDMRRIVALGGNFVLGIDDMTLARADIVGWDDLCAAAAAAAAEPTSVYMNRACAGVTVSDRVRRSTALAYAAAQIGSLSRLFGGTLDLPIRTASQAFSNTGEIDFGRLIESIDVSDFGNYLYVPFLREAKRLMSEMSGAPAPVEAPAPAAPAPAPVTSAPAAPSTVEVEDPVFTLAA